MQRVVRASLPLLLIGGLLAFPIDVSAQKGGKGKQGQTAGGRKGGKGGGQGAQKGDRESPAAHLPVGFHGLSKDEVKQLDGLTQRALGWICKTAPKRSSDEPVADFFGSLATDRGSRGGDGNAPDGKDDDNQSAERGREIGLLVMAVLDAKQRNQLAKLLVGQRGSMQEYGQLRDRLTAKLQELRGEQRPSRTFDRDVTQLAGELGEKEAEIAFAQARSFVALHKSIREDQLEYLRLVRANPDVLKTDNPAVQSVRDLLAKMEDRDQALLQSLAVKAMSFATGTAVENALARSSKSPSLLGTVKGGGKSDGSTTAFLATLTVSQQRTLFTVLQSEQRLAGGYTKRRSQLIAALDSLKDGKPVNEHKLKQAGGDLVEIEARAALLEARAFERLSTSLSKAQAVFISQNLLPEAKGKEDKQ